MTITAMLPGGRVSVRGALEDLRCKDFIGPDNSGLNLLALVVSAYRKKRCRQRNDVFRSTWHSWAALLSDMPSLRQLA